VDLSRFRPDTVTHESLRTDLGVDQHVPVFIFVGRLVRDKGVFDLMEAFGSVNAQYPLWELWMVGPDEDGIQADLEVRGQHLGARIRWFGSTPNPERYMSAADVFVLPSYREGFGSVIIEAAACGIPSIAYRIDGVIDAIVDGHTGVLVKERDVRGFSDAMRRLGTEANTRSALGEAAKLRARSEFSSVAVTTAWQAFYKAALEDTV
jgi:glycosyltransferase involved in cell wall biosynthesis